MSDLGCHNNEEAERAGEWMVRAIASLGLGLGLDTVIEGIETPQQREIARLAGCTEMQGYLVSPAVAGAEVAELILRLDRPLEQKFAIRGN